eukprot:5638870-Heterocapsa_arctica.AAC.1
MEDYEVMATNIQTSTTGRLRITPFGPMTGMEQHDMRGHCENMREEERTMTLDGVMRGEPIGMRPR